MHTGPRNFYSNGKLLITSEYLVLYGARALAMPVNKGQSLTVSFVPDFNGLKWYASVLGKEWFEAVYSGSDFFIQSANLPEVAARLRKYLLVAREMNFRWFPAEGGLKIETNLDFQSEWGLGSSSTLISNIAHLAEIDLFDFYFSVTNGSGYDVAAARVNYPIVYSLQNGQPHIEKINFNPDFRDSIYFVYSGKKQLSDKSVEDFKKNAIHYSVQIEKASWLTNQFPLARNLNEFNALIREHEELLSEVLKQKPVKQTLFQDFDGEVKSLGAWGGDFYMVTWQGSKDDLLKYFAKFGLQTILTFSEIALIK